MRTGHTLGAAFCPPHLQARLSSYLQWAFLVVTGLATFTFGLAVSPGDAQAAQPAQARSKTRLSTPASPARGAAGRAASRRVAATASPTAARKAASSKPLLPEVVAKKAVPSKTAARSADPRKPTRRSITVTAGHQLARALRGRKDTMRQGAGVKAVSLVQVLPARPTIGQAIGLHDVYDPLALHSSVALALDAATGEILFQKNARAVLPIASISKLMTAMVVLDARQPLDQVLEISEADIDTERFSRSRLRPGTELTRGEMLHLALMSSENRAANALGRHYSGGLGAFVARMNLKARELGMLSTHFIEPTGLSSSNVSNAIDLSKMVKAAAAYPLIRAYSTASSLTVDAGARPVSFHNTNRLIEHADWEIGLQKTGYISEAGNCMVMQAGIDGRPIVLVLLDANGSAARAGDAQRLRHWLEAAPPRFDGGLRALAQPSRGS